MVYTVVYIIAPERQEDARIGAFFDNFSDPELRGRQELLAHSATINSHTIQTLYTQHRHRRPYRRLEIYLRLEYSKIWTH